MKKAKKRIMCLINLFGLNSFFTSISISHVV